MIYWFDSEYFKLYSIHTEGVAEKQYKQHLEQAQEFDLVNLIGEDLKQDIQDKALSDTLTPDEETLLTYIKKYLLYKVELKLCDFLTYTNTSKGIINPSDSNTDNNNVQRLKTSFKDYITQTEERICKFLETSNLGSCKCGQKSEGIDVYFW